MFQEAPNSNPPFPETGESMGGKIITKEATCWDSHSFQEWIAVTFKWAHTATAIRKQEVCSHISIEKLSNNCNSVTSSRFRLLDFVIFGDMKNGDKNIGFSQCMFPQNLWLRTCASVLFFLFYSNAFPLSWRHLPWFEFGTGCLKYPAVL